MQRPQTALGLKTLTALVIANMVGAGVFTTSGFALADLGSPWRVLAAWIIGGLIALAGAASYGALARVVPESGGEYRYLSVNVHPAVGFVAGWVSLLAGFTGAIAFTALVFAEYVSLVTGGTHASAIATIVIVAAAVLHAVKFHPGAWLQNIAVAAKLVFMLGLCVIAAMSTPWQGLTEVVEGVYTPPPFSLAAFALSSVWISYSYLGFNAAVYLAGEVPSAQRLVPKALLIGTGLTALLYVALNAVFVLVPAYELVAGREDVATAAAVVLGGDWLAAAVRGLVALALFTSISAMIMIGPRVYARMAEDGLAPKVLDFAGETPTVAIAVQAALAVVVVHLAELRQLLSYLGFTLGLSSAAAVASLFLIARRKPELVEELTGYPWAPAIFVVFTLLFASLAASLNPGELLAAVLTVLSGLLVYAVARRFSA